MSEQSSVASSVESRWPVALALVSVIAMLVLLPDAIRLFPLWVTYVVGCAVLVPIIGVQVFAAKQRWLRVEDIVIMLFVAFVGFALLVNLVNLIGAMLYRTAETTGLQLLASGIGLWVANVLMFSLLYWHIDCGGPEARALDVEGKRADWLFPQEGMSSSGPFRQWRPAFVDYFYLGYSTATAFSATDAAPLSARAKLLMMLESTIALLTLALIASRAINILGT